MTNSNDPWKKPDDMLSKVGLWLVIGMLFFSVWLILRGETVMVGNTFPKIHTKGM